MKKIPWNKGIPCPKKVRDKIRKTCLAKGIMPSEKARKAAAIVCRNRISPRYKFGYTFTKKGYKKIWIRQEKRYVLEHRFIMEQFLKRKLLTLEAIHHKDGNKLNNEISNLQIISFSEHSRYHQPKIRGKFIKCSICKKSKKLWNIKNHCCTVCYKKLLKQK